MIGAVAAGVALAAAVGAHGTFHRNSQLFARPLGRLPRSYGSSVALTFDDGPNQEATPRILDALAFAEVKATFFLLGERAERWPKLVERVLSEGHEIGNHGYFHRKLSLAGPGYTRIDMARGTTAITIAAGRAPRLFRAPHGFLNPWVARVARSLGQRIIGWSVGVWDSDAPPAPAIAERVIRGTRRRSIILLHDGDGYDPFADRLQTALALPAILKELRSRGLSFVTVPA